MTQELLHCRVCGESAHIEHWANTKRVECDDVDGCGHQTPMFWTEAEAIAAWNTRAAAIPDPEAYMEAARGMREALEAIDTAFSEDDSTISCACDKALADGFTALLAFDAAQGEQ